MELSKLSRCIHHLYQFIEQNIEFAYRYNKSYMHINLIFSNASRLFVIIIIGSMFELVSFCPKTMHSHFGRYRHNNRYHQIMYTDELTHYTLMSIS